MFSRQRDFCLSEISEASCLVSVMFVKENETRDESEKSAPVIIVETISRLECKNSSQLQNIIASQLLLAAAIL